MSALEMLLGFSRFAAACFRFSLAGCQLPSSGGNVAVGRWQLTFSERNLDWGLARFVAAALWFYLEAAASRRSLLFISMRTKTLLTRCEQRAVHCISNENELLFFNFLLFHLHNQIARTAPEAGGVGDA